jgi:hypothetical protein
VVILGERERVARFNAVGTDTGLVEKLLKEFRLATFNARAETIAEKADVSGLIQEPTLPWWSGRRCNSAARWRAAK